jgi:hypothetical protein
VEGGCLLGLCILAPFLALLCLNVPLGASDIHIHVRSAYHVRHNMHDLPIVK